MQFRGLKLLVNIFDRGFSCCEKVGLFTHVDGAANLPTKRSFISDGGRFRFSGKYIEST